MGEIEGSGNTPFHDHQFAAARTHSDLLFYIGSRRFDPAVVSRKVCARHHLIIHCRILRDFTISSGFLCPPSRTVPHALLPFLGVQGYIQFIGVPCHCYIHHRPSNEEFMTGCLPKWLLWISNRVQGRSVQEFVAGSDEERDSRSGRDERIVEFRAAG